ncbi:MarR family winged helix-turn-helix transcriptional regulator [Nocardia niigatensis]|uniref:MarR family winged helix-turn-helix transcriptional regulator n=1 Tax=Nocardia niigatensis TaxID=209249 RepID=UPI00031EAFE4|nr:MarR family winged helix-turn-helix transcriptional regulator [Nocardia niigatensis]
MSDVDPRYPVLYESPAFLLGQLGSHSAYRFTELLAPLGVKPAHHGTLRILEANDGQSQQQLCEALGIHRNVMVGLVDDLEKRGLVERRRHPADRRAHAVHLLPAGRELLARTAEIARGLDAEMLAALAPADRATLIALLQQAATGNGLTPGIHPGLTVGRGGPECVPDH